MSLNSANKEDKFMQKSKGEFCWEKLIDIRKGRSVLGDEMPVFVYRLMHYSLFDILVKSIGFEGAVRQYRQAGFLAGSEFTKNLLDVSADVSEFIALAQKKLRELKMGIVRIESLDEETGDIVLTVEEDLTCSGMPVIGGMVCSYDEGFINGILNTYTGKNYMVREIDCWANGARICRYYGKII